MKSHTVSVVVEGRSIRVTPDPLMMTAEDELKWSTAGGQRFTVEFDGPGPFASRSLAHDAATKPQRPRTKGRFKYTVILESDASVRLDPEVIVGDPPTDPAP
jgi:hypothetical protein